MWLKQFFIFNFLIISITAAVGGPKKIRWELGEEEEKIDLKSLTDPIDGIDYRLPNNTMPIHYDIYLSTEIHRSIFPFEGMVTIQLKALENTSSVTVHYRQLVILLVDLLDVDGDLIQTNVQITFDEVREFLMIWPQNNLIKDQTYHVRISYMGMLRNDDAGFYYGSYVDSNGAIKYHATTQFESTDARHAFPCYDEPQIRTSFAVTIRHHSSYTAITNTPQISSTTDDIPGYQITRFEKIPSMQTYLLAFVVSDFISVQNETVVPPQRVWAKPSSIINGDASYALNISPAILKGFEEYLQVNYTFPKMDQIALPNFAAGAMENWGLVTYREIYLLYNQLTSTTRNKENVLLTIAHEFVHQWFGNLVNPEWWSYLWLNEGFATLYEYYLPHKVYPDERWDDSFLIDITQGVMETDSNPARRPMTHYRESPTAIDNLFDSVAYSKSGAVLGTFMHALGDSTWRKGLNYYLTNRFNNFANSDHLYEGLQQAVDEDFSPANFSVGEKMKSWEHQSGFPLITVSRSGSNITINQERFLYTGNDAASSLWHVPITYYTASASNASETKAEFYLLPIPSTVLTPNALRKIQADDDWIIFNTQQTFYYRVNYDENLWKLIIDQLNSASYDKIHLRNRAQLIDDSFHLARAAKIDYGIIFSLMNYLSKETDYLPWVTANRASASLNLWLSGSRIYADYQAFVRRNVAPLYNRLGVELIENEPRVDRYARTIAINLACQAQLPECLHETNQELLAFVYNDKRIAPEYVTTIYCHGMREANSVLFNYMTDKMLKSTTQTERNNIITAIGCMQDSKLLYDFLTLAIIPGSSITLSLAERTRILTAATPHGEDALKTILDFTVENLNYIQALNGSVFNSILSSVASRIGSQKLYDHFVEVITKIVENEGISQSNFETYKTNAMANLNWQAGNIQAIEEFFEFSEVESTTMENTTQAANDIIASTILLTSCLALKTFF